MKKVNAWKAYYISHSLLADFQENGGFHTMIAEEMLFNNVIDFLENKKTEAELLHDIEFDFGLKKKNLTKAIKNVKKNTEL